MSDERPDALLKSALEKIVYFEARSEQLHNDLESARGDVVRLQGELAEASQREIVLRRSVAGLEVELARSHREKDELSRMNAALRTERTALLEKLIEGSRIHRSDLPGADELEAPIDLAGFIAQLRSEALAAQQPGAAPALAVATVAAGARVTSPTGHAERLSAEGRLRVSDEQLQRLAGGAAFTGRVEETVFGFSVRELGAPDAAARIRAADRLRALGQAAAAPPLATALHGEREPAVLVALLSAFAEVASGEGVAIVLPLLESPSADVRLGSLKALLALDPLQAGPHLSAAMKDPDPAVRRRASLLALGLSGDGALGLGEQAVRDRDPEVRGLGALVLGAGGGDRARELLLETLRDPDRKVRKAAAQSLSRILGEDVSAVVELDDAQRRREVRRLAQLPVKLVRADAASAQRARDAQAGVRVRADAASAQRAQDAQVAAALPPAASARSLEPLCARLAEELRSAIRGRSEGELQTLTGVAAEDLREACALLVSRGHAVRRGMKLFAA